MTSLVLFACFLDKFGFHLCEIPENHGRSAPAHCISTSFSGIYSFPLIAKAQNDP